MTTREVRKVKTVKFFAVVLLAAVCFSACAAGEGGDAPVPYDEAYDNMPYYYYDVYSDEVYADESYCDVADIERYTNEADDTPPEDYLLDTTRMYIGFRSGSFSMHRIDEGEIIIVTSDGVTSEARSLLFAPDEDTLLADWRHGADLYRHPLFYRALAFSGDNILLAYTTLDAPDPFWHAIKNLVSGETTVLDFRHSQPVVLDNGLVAMFDATLPVRLYDMQTGLLADVQLDFDYGRLMYEAVGCRHFPNAYEMYVFGLVFDTQARQYLMLYAQDSGVRDDRYRFDEQGNWINDQGRLAVFDETGRQTDSFEIENLGSWRGEAQMSIAPSASDMLIYEGRIYINSYELDLAARFFHVWDRDRELSWSERERIRQGPPLPFIIIYTAEGTHIYSEDGDLLQALEGGFALSFYTFNEVGDAVMLFYRRAS